MIRLTPDATRCGFPLRAGGAERVRQVPECARKLKVSAARLARRAAFWQTGCVTIDRIAPVLVTGSAGRIGRAAVAALTAAGWHVRGFDRMPTPGAAESITGDLTDADALRHATRDTQAMIHLGASPDDDDFLTRLLPNNLVGLHHALEAAREAGMKRVLL